MTSISHKSIREQALEALAEDEAKRTADDKRLQRDLIEKQAQRLKERIKATLGIDVGWAPLDDEPVGINLSPDGHVYAILPADGHPEVWLEGHDGISDLMASLACLHHDIKQDTTTKVYAESMADLGRLYKEHEAGHQFCAAKAVQNGDLPF